jgi:hypothetical protein
MGGMRYSCLGFRILLAGLFGLASVPQVLAELPTLQEEQWLGNFIFFQNKHYRFTVTSKGECVIRMIGKKDEPIGQSFNIEVGFVIEELMPDGTTKLKKVSPEAYESSDPATAELQKVVIKGKVTGDAAFEVVVSQERGIVSLGGRLTDSGKLENPLRFSIQLKFPNAYPYEKKERDRKELKAFEDKSRADRIDLTLVDGRRMKLSTSDLIHATNADFNKPGIANAQIEFSSYQEKKMHVVASGHSALQLSNTREGPLHDGFVLTWTSDLAKDQEGKARLSFEAK